MTVEEAVKRLNRHFSGPVPFGQASDDAKQLVEAYGTIVVEIERLRRENWKGKPTSVCPDCGVNPHVFDSDEDFCPECHRRFDGK